MNPLVSSALGSLLRWALMLGAAALVKHGIWTDSEAGKYVEAGVVALLALSWSLWQQYKNRVKFLTALMPGPKTENEVIEHIASGSATPSILTPANTIPGVPLTPTAEGTTVQTTDKPAATPVKPPTVPKPTEERTTK